MLQRLKEFFFKDTKENMQNSYIEIAGKPDVSEILRQLYSNQIILDDSNSEGNNSEPKQTAPIPIPPSPNLARKVENTDSITSDDCPNFTSREMQELFRMSIEELETEDDLELFVPQDYSSGDSDITL